ncbi:unnamed protein product [Protopolystoma xenopodis]|uniref:Uncharacterized protein n=1 Tax=Protopolystoma xenopodis TaxID=117903 RepID=A0A448WQ53_9PLAT|nr:unnamed protein product [Protopolystoma xenopodis]
MNPSAGGGQNGGGGYTRSPLSTPPSPSPSPSTMLRAYDPDLDEPSPASASSDASIWSDLANVMFWPEHRLVGLSSPAARDSSNWLDSLFTSEEARSLDSSSRLVGDADLWPSARPPTSEPDSRGRWGLSSTFFTYHMPHISLFPATPHHKPVIVQSATCSPDNVRSPWRLSSWRHEYTWWARLVGNTGCSLAPQRWLLLLLAKTQT